MLKLITWNIQCARTRAERVSFATTLDAIIARLLRFAEPDLLLLQEVGAGFAAADGSIPAGDQFAGLSARLPGWHAAEAIAVDTVAPGGGRRRLGCMLFSRHPILQVLRHSLPWPSDPAVPSMPRVVLEAVVDTPLGPLRVLGAHLEYFSERQRLAQVEGLRALHAEACAHARHPRPGLGDGPFAALPRPAPAILMGDFNMLPGSLCHQRLLAPFGDVHEDTVPAWRDAWQVLQPERPHPPTVGLHDKSPGAGPHFTFDYAFVSANLAERVRAVRVDPAEGGSDHQPLLLELD